MVAGEPLGAALGGAYAGRDVLLTGHTGFKGSWLSLWLLELGARVHGYSLRPPTSPSHFDLCRLEQKMDSRIGDVRDHESLLLAFAETRPEVVFHLAAQPLVREAYRTPRETMATNVMGTVNLLDCVRLCPSVRAVVVITSDKCYENREWSYGYREVDPMGGHDPYSASKACAELVTAAYRRSFFQDTAAGARRVRVASARAGNVIGGGDWGEDRLIPDCVRFLSAKQPIVLRNPNAVRPWQHVLEPLSGYLQLGAALLAGNDAAAGPWNFGPLDPAVLTTHDVAAAFVDLWGEGEIQIAARDGEPHEAHLLRLSCEKAVTELRWRPLLTGREAVALTVDWYRSWLAGSNELSMLSVAQIRGYVEKARAARASWADPRSRDASARSPLPT